MLAELSAQIIAEREELLALSNVSKEGRAPVELDQQSVGRLSRMDALQQQSMDLAREERRQHRLAILVAVRILLCTADDLDKTSGRPSKSIDQCLKTLTSHEKPQPNGWTPSEVYGHGLVNLAAAVLRLLSHEAISMPLTRMQMCW